jgi:outer membrane protein assembly factor BamB
MALDAGSGKGLWDIEVKRVGKIPAIHAKNSHASPTPIVRDDGVYVHFGALGTAKLRPSDGGIEWLCEELDYPPVHGSGGSPVLRDNKLAIICDGSANPFVCALDSGSGKVVWRTPRSVSARISHSFGTVAMAVVDGRTQVLAPGSDTDVLLCRSCKNPVACTAQDRPCRIAQTNPIGRTWKLLAMVGQGVPETLAVVVATKHHKSRCILLGP